MTEFIRIGMSIFNAKKLQAIQCFENEIILEYDTGRAEIILDSPEAAAEMFENVCKAQRIFPYD